MTLSLRATVRRQRAIGAVAAAGAVLFASFGLDASLADASADAIDTAAVVEGSANADHADGHSDTAEEVANDPGAGGPTSTSAPATTTTVESLGGASTTSTTAATTTTTAAGSTPTSTPGATSTSTVTTTTTTTRPATTTTTVDDLGVASVTTVPLPGGALGGGPIDRDVNGVAPPASLAVSTTIRPTTPSTVATQRGATADESATKQIFTGATDAPTPLAGAPTTTAPPATTSLPGPTLPPPPSTEVPRPTVLTPATRPSYEVERAATVLLKGVEPVPSGARSSAGTTITLQFPWDSSQRIGVQLHASRLPTLWTVWVVIALLLMAFWLPGSKRQHAMARRSTR
ncbi:MAG: hypothetical protein IT196_16050 [Acidimicrobiales bacterium]|nr:hypothetical protein [Acidimicrobiales bacterium]